MAVVEEIRPELHRYCSRMVGSVADGEDVLQDTLAQAYYALSMTKQEVELRPWLFRIAHNKAIDFLRRYDRRHVEPMRERHEQVHAAQPEDPVVRQETATLALTTFVDALPPRERACVILKDVLDHSLREVSSTLDMTVSAVKAALHRGRTKLRGFRQRSHPVRQLAPEQRRVLERYVALFNARDWDGVRALLAEDVRLDLVAFARREGKAAVETYFANYEKIPCWQLGLAVIDGEEVIIVYKNTEDTLRPTTIVRLAVDDGRVTEIRDYRNVAYLLTETNVT